MLFALFSICYPELPYIFRFISMPFLSVIRDSSLSLYILSFRNSYHGNLYSIYHDPYYKTCAIYDGQKMSTAGHEQFQCGQHGELFY